MAFHGHGGRNLMFVNRAVGVHAYGFIGVYPQGASYDGRSGWNDGSFGPDCCPHGGGGDQCLWNEFNCTADPNDGAWAAAIVATVTSLGARGRWYAYGSSNGANEAQILAANAVVHPAALPLAGIAVHSGQLLAEPTRSAPNPYFSPGPLCARLRSKDLDGSSHPGCRRAVPLQITAASASNATQRVTYS